MLHLIYILAFTIIAFFAISNLIRSLIALSSESQKGRWTAEPKKTGPFGNSPLTKPTHPELFDGTGKPINEPLLVIRSVSVEDARQKLDSIYNSSPGQTNSSQSQPSEEEN